MHKEYMKVLRGKAVQSALRSLASSLVLITPKPTQFRLNSTAHTYIYTQARKHTHTHAHTHTHFQVSSEKH